MIYLDGYGLLVKPDIAEAQLSKEREEAEAKKSAEAANPVKSNPNIENGSRETTANEEDPKTAKRTRFIGHVETDSTRLFRFTDDIEKEILKHLKLAAGT